MGFYEGYDSRNAAFTDESGRRERLYYVTDTDSDTVAESTARANLPAIVNGLILNEFDVERIANMLWLVTAKYVDPDSDDKEEKPDLGEVVWSFETGGGNTQRITVNKKGNTASYAAAGKTAIDFKGAINVTSDGVEGVDVLLPSLTLAAEVRLANATLTNSYMKTLARLTATVNDDVFYGFAAGEVLFLGASGRQKVGSGDPTLTFSFEASENATNLVYVDWQGDDITVATKKGHEYLWAHSVNADDAAAKSLVQRPHSVYVETVYEESDFGLLGIGS